MVKFEKSFFEIGNEKRIPTINGSIQHCTRCCKEQEKKNERCNIWKENKIKKIIFILRLLLA